MKKIVMTAALALAATATFAQGGAFSYSDPVTISRSLDNDIMSDVDIDLPNWIDLNPENLNMYSTTNNPDSWADLNNGFAIGSFVLGISATRECKVRAMAENADGPGSNSFPANRYSLVVNNAFPAAPAGNATINPGTLTQANNVYMVAGTGFAATVAGVASQGVQVAANSTGCYKQRFGWTLWAFQSTAAGGTLPVGDYYSHNLEGGEYTTDLRFAAYLD